MLTKPRWYAERSVMANVLPQFTPFVNGSSFGFRGKLFGKRQWAGRPIYVVEIRALKSSFPRRTPYIFITPRVGPNWLANGALCVTQPWDPARSTFLQLVLYAAAYLKKEG